jgi:DNA-binding CsgD family transcriptional regulator
MLDAVHTLPPRQRDIALAVAKGLTVSEYAKSSGLSVPGAFNAWRNAKEKLTNTLATYEEEAA